MVSQENAFDAVVVGGGFYGAMLACSLSRKFERIALIERENTLLARASYHNQARVHNGYHYPRSLLTGLRSRVNLPAFSRDFGSCVVDSFEKYYGIAKRFSNVTSLQFVQFCQRIGAPIEKAVSSIARLFNSDTVDGVFRVVEFAFDAERLSKEAAARLARERVKLVLRGNVRKVIAKSGVLDVLFERDGKEARVSSHYVFNCTYALVNKLLESSELHSIPIQRKLAEIALVRPPDEIQEAGVTLMCGPFFSTLPFPPRQLHSLSHVLYTHHASDLDSDECCLDPRKWVEKSGIKSNFSKMVRDGARYLPCLESCQHVDSLWEVKALLPRSFADDSRPILLHRDETQPNFISILGGKIDNIYDVLAEVDRQVLAGVAR